MQEIILTILVVIEIVVVAQQAKQGYKEIKEFLTMDESE